MSWWTDREPFDEYDPPYCAECSGGNSYEQCKRCEEEHDNAEDRMNIEDMIKALRCLGSVHLDSCYINQYNKKHPNDMIYCKEGSCPHYQDTYGVCFGDDDTSWLSKAADELERMAKEA